jgi:hypothetical protein
VNQSINQSSVASYLRVSKSSCTPSVSSYVPITQSVSLRTNIALSAVPYSRWTYTGINPGELSCSALLIIGPVYFMTYPQQKIAKHQLCRLFLLSVVAWCVSTKWNFVLDTEHNYILVYMFYLKLKLIYDRQSVGQFVWVSGLPLGPLTRFYFALLFFFGRQLLDSSF